MAGQERYIDLIDQPHQIVVYPNRAKLLLYLCLYLAVAAVFGPMFVWGTFLLASRTGLNIVGGTVVGGLAFVGALLFVVILACTLYRILVRKPSVIVNSEGIFDGCSMLAGGYGLIRWEEIAALVEYWYQQRHAYLIVMPRDVAALRMRHSLLLRMFRRSITLTLPAGAILPQWLMSIPVSELVADIQRRYGQTLNAHSVSVLGSAKRPLQR
ncbi:MAG TPA: hypothetical protein VFN11_10100 [Ktedonobacterales bacterium]|nr:hypothetical protein [Ktedonobacterales bacterium]